MPVLSINGFIGKRDEDGYGGRFPYIRNIEGKVQSILGYKRQTLIIGALENKESTILTRAIDQIGGQLANFIDPLSEKLSGQYKQDGVEVDAIMDYEGELSVTLSKNPVQKFANINDTRIPQPQTLQIELGVSNDVVTSMTGQAKKILAGVASLAGYDLYDRRILTFNKFKRLLYEGKPFKIVTPHGEYENMLLVRIKPKTTEETYGLFYGTLYFQEVITFDSITDYTSKFTSPQGQDLEDLKQTAELTGQTTEWTDKSISMVDKIVK